MLKICSFPSAFIDVFKGVDYVILASAWFICVLFSVYDIDWFIVFQYK